MQTDPARRLTLPPRNSGWKHNLKLGLGILMFLGVLVAMGIYTAPDLVTDWQVRDAARPVPAGRITKGSCSSNVVVNICDATLVVPTAAGPVSRSVNYIFTGVHIGDYTAEVMADPGHPELATTDLALDKLWNRTLTFLVAVVVLLGLTCLPLLAIAKRRRLSASPSTS